MKLSQLFRNKKQVLSFEIFPPKPEVPLENLFDSIPGFKALSPDYISVTYGAGKLKGRTVEIASRLKNTYGIEAMAHLTCVGHSVEQIDQVLESLKHENREYFGSEGIRLLTSPILILVRALSGMPTN